MVVTSDLARLTIDAKSLVSLVVMHALVDFLTCRLSSNGFVFLIKSAFFISYLITLK